MFFAIIVYKVCLQSVYLPAGIDWTKSNEWQGQRTFAGRCLHQCDSRWLNPYEEVISVIGRTLAPLDEDNLIPFYGFGDSTTRDSGCFSFLPADAPAAGVEAGLARYRQIAAHVRLSGPTSFAPVIRQAMRVVRQNGGAYHVLLIIADGQARTAPGQRPSQRERALRPPGWGAHHCTAAGLPQRGPGAGHAELAGGGDGGSNRGRLPLRALHRHGGRRRRAVGHDAGVR